MNRAKTTQVAVEEEIISSAPKSRVRDRIMKTASELFYRYGIHAVGVDTIANEAGTNKMSFYRNFASKDELVAEYLRSEEREGLLWWDETLAAHAGNPRLQVEHTITEEVWGVDLVQAQLRGVLPESAGPRGTAIQLRVNLETMTADGSAKPGGGTISVFEPRKSPEN